MKRKAGKGICQCTLQHLNTFVSPTSLCVETPFVFEMLFKTEVKVTKCKCVQNVKEVSSLENYSGCNSPMILTSKISWNFPPYENSNH